jgi:hypothetical protein
MLGGSVSSEISILLRDRVPSRTIGYPISAPQINEALLGVVPLEVVALFFLYDSSAQASHYDPAKSMAQRYPIVALRRGLPKLRVPVLAGDLETNPETRSILVFPVKMRLKQRISEALVELGMRPIARWFTAKSTPEAPQRSLVLIYDEADQRVTAKFAEDWSGPEVDRRYY